MTNQSASAIKTIAALLTLLAVAILHSQGVIGTNSAVFVGLAAVVVL